MGWWSGGGVGCWSNGIHGFIISWPYPGLDAPFLLLRQHLARIMLGMILSEDNRKFERRLRPAR